MKTPHRNASSLARLVGALALLLGALAARPSHAGPEAGEAQRPESSRSANTPQDHATLARQYRLKAEALEAQAARLDAAASPHASPFARKFPAPFDKKAAEAVESRRAAAEARAMAQWHLSRAVETAHGQ